MFNNIINQFSIFNNQLTPTKNLICGGKCPFLDSTFRFNNREEIVGFIIAFAKFFTYLAVPIAIVMIIFSGFKLLFGLGGDKPLQPFINIIIGLTIVILAYTFTAGFSDFLSNGVTKLF